MLVEQTDFPTAAEMRDGKTTKMRSRKESEGGKRRVDQMKIITEETEEEERGSKTVCLLDSAPAQCVIRPPKGSKTFRTLSSTGL